MQRDDKYDCPHCRETGQKSTFEPDDANSYILHLLGHVGKLDPFASKVCITPRIPQRVDTVHLARVERVVTVAWLLELKRVLENTNAQTPTYRTGVKTLWEETCRLLRE